MVQRLNDIRDCEVQDNEALSKEQRLSQVFNIVTATNMES